MPKEDILVEGDYVNELFVIVTGEVQVTRSLHTSCAALPDRMLSQAHLPSLAVC